MAPARHRPATALVLLSALGAPLGAFGCATSSTTPNSTETALVPASAPHGNGAAPDGEGSASHGKDAAPDAKSAVPDAKGAAKAETASAPEAAPAANREIPLSCSGAGQSCYPPAAFAHAVCKGKYPDLALVLFGKSSPWQRAYVKAEYVEPVNVYGGPTDEQWMYFGEAVIVLFEHSAEGKHKGVVQVSGPVDVDVLRIDGTCATVRREMLVGYVPGPMKSPYVVWKYLDAAMQEALLADEGVQQAHAAERKICRGESVTHPEEACAKAMNTLTQAILVALQRGVALPTPEKRPEW